MKFKYIVRTHPTGQYEALTMSDLLGFVRYCMNNGYEITKIFKEPR
jgi:hypothetical protein